MALDNLSKSLPPSSQRRPGLLRDQVQLVKRKDCDRYEIAPIPELLSFEKGFFIVIRACQLLTQHMDGIIVVGLAGPSGAGKTVFTEKMLSFMPSIAAISMDNYNDSSRLIDGNFDDPRLTDYETLLDNIHGLKAGKPVQVPVYDFKQSCRIGYRTLEVPSSRIVILEGIYALSERLRPVLDLRVSVTGGVHFDLVKRVLRDIHRAGQEPEEIIQQISETVYPMYKAYIEPDLQTAHIRIKNKFNPFSGFQTPTYILKSSKTLTEDQIKACISPKHVVTMEETYDIYLLPPAEDPEACQSYLRMRNRDGKYSLMFEEWVTDNPFIISPRITFEVSVRLLGGLMALGYTIATILKRKSRVFSDDKVCIKMDWLEQLNRKYVQVQGRDRNTVRVVAEQLGLEGSYIPRTYIEQIQLERLLKEVMALPEDLKTKLSIDEEFVSSPRLSLPRTLTHNLPTNKKFSKSLSLTRNFTKGIPVSELERVPSTQRDRNRTELPRLDVNNKRFDSRLPDSPAYLSENQGIITQLSEQISTLNERLDELVSRLDKLNAKSAPVSGSHSHQNLTLQAEPSGVPTPISSNIMNGPRMPISTSSGQLTVESSLMEEITLLTRGQRQIGHQLDILSTLLHENLGHHNQQERNEKAKFLNNINVGYMTCSFVFLLAIGGVSTVLLRTMRKH
ncbi:inorganic pyrophosphatase TTM1 isoform X1 [Cryptomeria japonica]|uniref:inorganic pyrophosphatase TTM1 isoform X1 n=1 Tax=Cryptomeria japonica TaxID=3369 RepID=UPI0027DAA917|nr:inorganic pyrophosphatase TTM1 isoform X1 [Cryptomeria japonica]XP_057843630.2 inorganic pyrophosphatase TTM1 isoform X1 [Cryptomeria japonica]